jgi:hypothetical protein
MSEIQSIAQNNYILQAPPPTATMFTTELEYDGDKISGYAGSAFKAGIDLEFGYTDADTISSINNSAITDASLNNIVQTNSGAWGGSALPVSAGPGIKVNLVDNTLVFSNDETVLYTGNTSVTAFTASEPFTNFREVVFYVSPNNSLPAAKVALPIIGYNTSSLALTYHSIWNGFSGGIQISTEYTNTGMSAFQLTTGAWFGWAGDSAKTGTYWDACIYKIIGINRIAGGN